MSVLRTCFRRHRRFPLIVVLLQQCVMYIYIYTRVYVYVCACVPPREFINNNALGICIREIKPLLVRTYNIEFAQVFMAGHNIYDVRHRRRVGQLLRPTTDITMRLLRCFR